MKPSINDALAGIAQEAEEQRGNVKTRERDDVSTHPSTARANATLSQKPVSLDKSRGNVETGSVTTPEGYKVRQRVEKPHVSLYVHPRIIKTVREIAMAQNRKAHDVYVEGLRMALKAYGYDYDDLSRVDG